MLSGNLWPAHPQLLPDELLSSWIVRVAETNGIKLYTLTLGLFGDRLTPWHRDIDRLAPKWLLKAFCAKTGLNYWDAYHATLTGYRGYLYPRRQSCGQLRWILPISTFGLDRHGYGQQYCSVCLDEDIIPYFRRVWRVGFFTFCPIHGCMLLDACHECGFPVAPHRRDVGREVAESRDLAHCQHCSADYRKAAYKEVTNAQPEHVALLRWMSSGLAADARYNIGFFAVVHQLCKVLGTTANGGRLYRWVAEQLKTSQPMLNPSRIPVESRRVNERHALVSQALWILEDMERLVAAWRANTVRFNHLLKDLEAPPKWYVKTCLRLRRPLVRQGIAKIA